MKFKYKDKVKGEDEFYGKFEGFVYDYEDFLETNKSCRIEITKGIAKGEKISYPEMSLTKIK